MRLAKKRMGQAKLLNPPFQYKHQSYCWQVGLHQSLRPLQIDNNIVSINNENVTNHLSVHYQLVEEVKKLRMGIREHRDSTGHDLCWRHPWR